MTYLLAIAFALIHGSAWWLTDSAWGAALGWISCIPLVLIARDTSRLYRSFYLAGLVFQPIGFYWLWGTIADFGGFTFIPTLAIFALYVVLSAVQFLFAAAIFRFLPLALDRLCLRLALAWVVSEQISIRIFPWYLGHTQLGFPILAQSAELLGAPLITVLMIASVEGLLKLLSTRRSVFAAVPLVVLAALLCFGSVRLNYFNQHPFPAINVALIQANVSVEEKHQIKSFRTNVKRYVDLSLRPQLPNTLVIWPETVLMDWIYSGVGDVRLDARLPYLGKDKTLLTGALTYGPSKTLHNSALMVYPNGAVPEPYHKIFLMPFGEYTPLSGIFPWLKEINVTAGEFAPGPGVSVFPVDTGAGAPALVSPLICYEDVVAYLARESVEHGATLLVNLTNDAWFGRSVAAVQHHQIAAFRAIENRRTLLRSTNTGLTAIVLPSGETVVTLPKFSEGYLEREVPLVEELTFFVRSAADKLWTILSILLACAAVVRGVIFLRKA